MSNKKTSPVTPKVINRISRTGSTKSGSPSPSPLQNPRCLVDRSLKSVASKPTKQTRAPKASELQVQLDAVREELNKAREELVSVEKEKARALEEWKDAKKSADEANEKLGEALFSKERVDESSEVAFRAGELDRAGTGTGRKREEEWQKELENERNQHAADVAALFAATQELQRVQNELALASEEKNTALSHANDAMKTAEINAEKIESLSREVIRVKAWLESEIEPASNETAELVRIWESEVDPQRNTFGKAKASEEKLVVMKALVEGLRTGVSDAKRAETDVSKLAKEWKRTTELLEVQLEERNFQLHDADSEMSALKGKVETLEVEAARCRTDLEESDRRLELAQLEAMELEKMVEAFKSKFQMLEEEKLWAINNVNIAAADNEILMEERSKLINELQITRDEGEKRKKAMEGLASALHEVSTKARETQEMLLTKQVESEDACSEIEKLKSALKNKEERYEIMLDEARYEIVCLRNANERYLTEVDTSRTEWEAKEIDFSNAIKRSEELAAFKGMDNEARAAKEDGIQIMTKLRQAEFDAAAAKEAAEEVRAESFRLKERLLDQENELQSITHENDGLRIREAAALEKVTELTALLGDVRVKRLEEIDVLFNNKNVYNLLPETMKFHDENTIKSGAVLRKHEVHHREYRTPEENANGSFRREEKPLKVESFRDIDKDLASERIHEEDTTSDELESKMDSDSFNWINRPTSDKMENGSLSPSKSQQQKKKTALLHKFGSLLKKKKGNHK